MKRMHVTDVGSKCFWQICLLHVKRNLRVHTQEELEEIEDWGWIIQKEFVQDSDAPPPQKKKISSLLFIHLLTSIHLLTVPVTVAGVGVHTDQGTAGVGLITRRNCQGWES